MKFLNGNTDINMNFKLLVLFILIQAKVFCQNISIVTPNFDDEYSRVTAKLEQGNTGIDYKLYRESLLKSNQYNLIITSKHIVDSLGYFMFKAEEETDYTNVINFANRILSIDYTNMTVHKMLYKAYKFKGDTLNAKKYADIENGLLKSIISSGNGNSCATAWAVVQVTEEGYVLKMLGGEIMNMETDKDSLCDKFTINLTTVKKDYYFKRINNNVQ